METPVSATACEDAVQQSLDEDKTKGKKVIFLYSTKEATETLTGLTLITDDDDDHICIAKHTKESVASEAEMASTAFPCVTKMSCSNCSLSFDSRTDLVDHFKGDFHRFNVRRKIRGFSPVSEQTFEQMTGDISSISGSDSEDSDSTDTSRDEWMPAPPSGIDVPSGDKGFMNSYSRRQRIFFRNGKGELVSVHRCLVFGKKSQLNSSADMLCAVEALPVAQKWALFMAGGGHFAGALFDGETVVKHKTFHRYVVRAKRGTAQSQRDKQGNAPRSAGATLRRYNETALTQEIQDLITSWSADLKSCSRIFLRAPGFNSAVFFGGKTPVFDKSDQRIYTISIHTRRPTFHELKRVHKALCAIEVFDPDCSVNECISPKKLPNPDGANVLSSHENKPAEYQCTEKHSTESQSMKKQPTENRSTENQSTENQFTESYTSPGTVEPKQHDGETPDFEEKHIGESSDSDSELDLLTWETAFSDTSLLKEFDGTKKPRCKKRTGGKKGKKKKEGVHLNGEQLKIRNQLFTACKTGDLGAFQQAMDSLCESLRKLNINNGGDNILAASGDVLGSCALSLDCVPPPSPYTSEETPTEAVLEQSSSLSDVHKRLSEFLSLRFGPQLTTLLHTATRTGNKQIMNLLMTHGADPAVRDMQNQVPFLAATTKDTKNEFRRFMAQNPTKYDYVKAQVPGPLTGEMENERKVKANEKKKTQKKAKKEKLKEVQLEEERKKAEEEARRAFLAMSDREKCAYAAEQRFKLQLEQQNSGKNTILSRCWQCASDLTGKVPFEYYHYKFCSPTCLKQHRLKTSK